MFGFIIRKEREKRELSQEYMASQLHITQAAYSNIESDKTDLSVKRLYEICKLLDVDVAELIRSYRKPSE
jgi:transcriptional regulator with XRE-family HTH domain